MLRPLVTWSYDNRRKVLLIWVAALAVMVALAGTVGGSNQGGYTLPGSESARAIDLLDERFPDVSGATADVVYHSAVGADSPEAQADVEALRRDVEAIDSVLAAEAGPISEDGTTGLVQVRFEQDVEDVPPADVELLMEHVADAGTADLQVEVGGFVVEIVESASGESGSEMIGMLGALVVLLVAFGSAVAAGLPLLIAGFGLAIAMSGIWLVANLIDVADWAVLVATMIGIGVGIDYSLFIVTRYRSALADGKPPRDAVVLAGTTAGRAVMYAGLTAVIALWGLVIIGSFYIGVATSVSFAILAVLVASATVLPAALGFAGRSIERLRMPWYRPQRSGRHTLAWRWSRLMQRRAVWATVLATALLVLLTVPAFGMQLGQPDAGSNPDSMTARRAFDLQHDGFGPGSNGPLIVTLDLAADGDANGADAVTVASAVTGPVQGTDGVAAVLPAETNDTGDIAVMTVIPETGPQADETRDLVKELRNDVLPAALADSGAEAYVGGNTAGFMDESDHTSSRLPFFVGGVILLSFVVLVAVFRSVVIALKAALMNLLSIGAAYGVIALAAEGGWFGGLFGIQEATPIPAWLPALMFAVLFGLSMDYEVFLLSRIREIYQRTGDTSRSVADGLAGTARVITAAAAIMVVVSSAFVLEDLVFIKLAGLGLATAILVDATVVRMVLVPAVMELLGSRNWWMPAWLDRLLPELDMGDGADDDTADSAGDADPGDRREDREMIPA